MVELTSSVEGVEWGVVGLSEERFKFNILVVTRKIPHPGYLKVIKSNLKVIASSTIYDFTWPQN